MEGEKVWLEIDGQEVEGTLLWYGAYFSRIKYTLGGMDYEVLVENEDFEFDDESEDG